MRPIRQIERLADALISGDLDRREFLRRAAAAGLGATAAGLLLQACGGGAPGGDEGPESDARVPDAIEDRLAIYNWSDYVADDTIPADSRRSTGSRSPTIRTSRMRRCWPSSRPERPATTSCFRPGTSSKP
jgi:hypothetical protein